MTQNVMDNGNVLIWKYDDFLLRVCRYGIFHSATVFL
jgi:hypothetical protein